MTPIPRGGGRDAGRSVDSINAARTARRGAVGRRSFAVIRWLQRDYISNASLRERFSLQDDDYQIASAIISQARRDGRIREAEPNQGRRNAKYIPYWAA
jgi:hypothetical protein